MNKKPNQTDYAYIAGYIDGDGCFSIRKERRKYRMSPKFPAAIIIASVNKEVLDWAKNLFGGSISKQTNVPNKHKPIYYFVLRKTRALPFTNNIIGYLVEKIYEAESFMDFCSLKDIRQQNECIHYMSVLKKTSNLVSRHDKEEFEQLRNTVTPTETDFAYLAGFIDAECCLCIQKYKPKNRPNYTYKILLQCNDTKALVFKWLLKRFGGHINFIDRQTHTKAIKNQLCWRLSGNALSKILPSIQPFLKHKKPVCEELMKFYKTTLMNGGARHTQSFRNAYAETLKIREEIVSRIHKLNLKGIKTT
jgi:hypothetical protein